MYVRDAAGSIAVIHEGDSDAPKENRLKSCFINPARADLKVIRNYSENLNEPRTREQVHGDWNGTRSKLRGTPQQSVGNSLPSLQCLLWPMASRPRSVTGPAAQMTTTTLIMQAPS